VLVVGREGAHAAAQAPGQLHRDGLVHRDNPLRAVAGGAAPPAGQLAAAAAAPARGLGDQREPRPRVAGRAPGHGAPEPGAAPRRGARGRRRGGVHHRGAQGASFPGLSVEGEAGRGEPPAAWDARRQQDAVVVAGAAPGARVPSRPCAVLQQGLGLLVFHLDSPAVGPVPDVERGEQRGRLLSQAQEGH